MELFLKRKFIIDAHEPIMLPSFEEICNNKKAYIKSFAIQYRNTDHFNAKVLVEPYDGWYIVQNRPNRPLKQREFDRTYSYDYKRIVIQYMIIFQQLMKLSFL